MEDREVSTPATAPCKSKELCSGCYNDFYNGKPGGCWSYEKATVTRKAFVHVDQVPPFQNKPHWTLSCHHKQRFVEFSPKEVESDARFID